MSVQVDLGRTVRRVPGVPEVFDASGTKTLEVLDAVEDFPVGADPVGKYNVML